MSLEKEFVPYEQVLALKELGFDEPCLACWTNRKSEEYYLYFGGIEYIEDGGYTNPMKGNVVSAPTFSQAFRWFREKYNLRFYIASNADHEIYGKDTYELVIFKKFGKSLHNENDDFKTYEEAELACLKKLIEIVKEKQP